MKQWSLNSVFRAHDYGFIKPAKFHEEFNEWIKKTFDKKIKIIDIGGGNGRVCLSLEDSFYEYWSYDISQDNINTGISFFKEDSRVNFRLFDIDDQKIEESCDVIYIDSVLTMIENPFDALLKFKDVAQYTFVNRTSFSQETVKDSYLWSGMMDKSTLWRFDYTSFNNFCIKNNLELKVLGEYSFVIKNN